MREFLVNADFYHREGLWMAGGNLLIEKNDIESIDQLKQLIVDNQTVLRDGWQGNYFVVLNEKNGYPLSPNHKKYRRVLFKPEDFVGYKKKL